MSAGQETIHSSDVYYQSHVCHCVHCFVTVLAVNMLSGSSLALEDRQNSELSQAAAENLVRSTASSVVRAASVSVLCIRRLKSVH